MKLEPMTEDRVRLIVRQEMSNFKLPYLDTEQHDAEYAKCADNAQWAEQARVMTTEQLWGPAILGTGMALSVVACVVVVHLLWFR